MLTNVLRGTFELRLNPPRGRSTPTPVPLCGAPSGAAWTSRDRASWSPRCARAGPPWQAPACAAGTSSWRSTGGAPLQTAARLAAVLRGLPAGCPAARSPCGGATRPARPSSPPGPDWEPTPDWQRIFDVVLQRDPRALAYHYAAVPAKLDMGDPDGAAALWAQWPLGWRRAAVGQLVEGDLLAGARALQRGAGRVQPRRQGRPHDGPGAVRARDGAVRARAHGRVGRRVPGRDQHRPQRPGGLRIHSFLLLRMDDLPARSTRPTGPCRSTAGTPTPTSPAGWR